MGDAAAKLSISVPGHLADAVRRRVGPRGLSGFVARAIAHELEREQLGGFLDELSEKQGRSANRYFEQSTDGNYRAARNRRHHACASGGATATVNSRISSSQASRCSGVSNPKTRNCSSETE